MTQSGGQGPEGHGAGGQGPEGHGAEGQGPEVHRAEGHSPGGHRRYLLWMLLALLVVVVDQATKAAIVKWIPYLGSVELNAFTNLTHQRNYGAAWSFLADAGGWQRWFFVVLATGVSAFIAVWMWRIRDGRYLVLALGLSLVLGGAIGNLVDRIRLGYVVDFIQVWFGSWPFPSFNVADSAITVGAALLIIDSLFISGREEASPDTRDS